MIACCPLRWRGYRIALVKHQAVAFRLADMARLIAVVRQMVHHAAALRDAGKPALVEVSMAQLSAIGNGREGVFGSIHTFGGYGYLKDFPLERLHRDVRLCQIQEGTSDIQRLVIARNLGGQ